MPDPGSEPLIQSCQWCGMTQGHSEVCEGFNVNDPGRRVEPLTESRVRIVVTDLPLVTCARCAGRGEVAVGNSTTMWVRCPACKGLGDRVCAR